jgi:hypothetical protein
MLYLNTLLTELGNRYVGVPRAFYSTNVDCENDHVTLLRTEASIAENFLKMHYAKAYLVVNINKRNKQTKDTSDKNAGRITTDVVPDISGKKR